MTIFAVYLARVRVYEDPPDGVLRNPSITTIVADFTYKRRVAEVLLDLCLVTLAYYAAYRLRFESGEEFKTNFTSFYRSLPLVLATQLIVLFAVGIYRGVWRYFGLMDVVVVAKGVALGTVCSQLVILYVLRFEGFSRTVFVMYAIILAAMLTGSRASFRLLGEFLHRSRNAAKRVVVYGAGDGGSLVVRELMKASDARYRILGFVDDDTRKQRIRIQGYPVLGGYDSLVSLVRSSVIDAVVISARMMSIDRLQDLEALCGEHGVSLSRLHVGLEPLIVGQAEPVIDAAVSPLRKNAS
jgi:UDP-GlcNAc:undecaprenyl-phosphate GlcNAc-1-phosphate transferase